MAASPYCPHCGALNPSDKQTCFACGHALAAATSASVAVSGGIRLLRRRYRIVRQIGAGGFAAVYRAEDTQLGNRLVAVKEMSARGLTPEEVREATDSFHREALLLARLSHPNLPRIYEQFEEAGRWYLVMDFIEGETLEDYLKYQGGSLPVKEALQLGLQLTNVLGYLHTRQPPIVFRDLKPSNVMLTPDGRVYLIDFGIARLFKPGQQKDTIAFGSPGYAAPEQYGKAQTTPRSDVFSLGALLHQMLTGIDPSDTPFRFKPLTMPRPAGLSVLIERMVALDVEQRPASMELVRDDLEQMLRDPAPWRSDERDIALPGASLRLTQAATGAFPSVAPAPPVWQAPPAQGGPVMTPAPARKKKNTLGRFIGLAVAAWLVFMFLSHLGNMSSTVGDGGDNPSASSVVPVYALSWSPDGAYIASGGDDGKIQIWNESSIRTNQVLITNLAEVNTLAWSPNSKYLAAAGDQGKVQIWQADGTLVIGYSFSSFNINAISWSADNKRIVLASEDGVVRVVDALTGHNSVVYRAGSDPVTVAAWSPDGKYIAAGGSARTVQVWDSTTGKLIYTYQDYEGAIDALAWSPDSKRIVIADTVGDMLIWDALTGKHVFTYPFLDVPAYTIAWSPNGDYVACGNENGNVQVWAAEKGTLVYTYTSQSDIVRAIAWSRDSQHIASASGDGTVQIWDALTGDNPVTYQQP